MQQFSSVPRPVDNTYITDNGAEDQLPTKEMITQSLGGSLPNMLQNTSTLAAAKRQKYLVYLGDSRG